MDRLLRALLIAGIVAPLAAAVVWWTADPEWFRSPAESHARADDRAQAATESGVELLAVANRDASADRLTASPDAPQSRASAPSLLSTPHQVVPVALHFDGPPAPHPGGIGNATARQEPPILLWPADEVRDPQPVETVPHEDEQSIGDPDDPSDSAPAEKIAPLDVTMAPPNVGLPGSANPTLRRLPPVSTTLSSKDPAAEYPTQIVEDAAGRDGPQLELQPADAPPWAPLRRLPPVDSSRSQEPVEQPPLDTAQLDRAPAGPTTADHAPVDPAPAKPAPTDIPSDSEPGATMPRVALGLNAHGSLDLAPPATSTPVDDGDVAPHHVVGAGDAIVPNTIDNRDSAAARAATIATERAMEGVRQRANDHLRSGLAVASRGAFYSGRADFIQALRVLAQALDAQSRKRSHSDSLARGLVALEEADDFVPKGSALEADLNVASIVSAHRTPVLKETDPAPTPLEALQAYYTYAQDQLVAACGHEPSASLALYALGKTHLALAQESREAETLHGPKAVALMRASLAVDSTNHLAANELGVMLAGYGQLAEARAALVHAVSLGGPVEAWHNLAVVHERLGEEELARAALAQWQAASRQGQGGAAAAALPSAVRWVDTATFARTSDTPTSGAFIPSGSAQVPSATSSASQPQGARTGQQPWQGFRK